MGRTGGIPYRPRRDARFDHSGEAVEAIIRWNCEGCIVPSPVSINRLGPGGDCAILASVAGGYDAPIPQLLDSATTIHCTARRADPPSPSPPPQAETLFDEVP